MKIRPYPWYNHHIETGHSPMSTMKPDEKDTITETLCAATRDNVVDPRSCDPILPFVYEELRRLAANMMRDERQNHTLQPTALVHEAYVRLVDQTRVNWRGRAHFLAIASRAMRRVLVDHARGRARMKRGGGWKRITLNEEVLPGTILTEVIAIDRALDALASEDERAARIAECRIIGGLTVKETAEVIGVSARTVNNDWTMARLWLARAIRGDQ